MSSRASINITVPQADVTANSMCLDVLEMYIEIEYLYWLSKTLQGFNNVYR